MNAKYYIDKLGLTKHVEGGAFKETYRADLIIENNALTPNFKGDKHASTGIYFLLEYGQFSSFHRIASDEMWHFYDGDTLTIYEIESNGTLITHKLGRNLAAGETFQCVIKAGNWFGSRCEITEGFSLVGCTVAPGFDFADFELANKSILQNQHPHLANLIDEMTY
ncbi:MAG: cupin domain-containing protein [Bacteroidota bacterium]